MMRAAALSTISYVVMMMFDASPSNDVTGYGFIIDKYGLPLALAAAIFVYFSREIRAVRQAKAESDKENDTLREQMLAEQKEQTIEARTQTEFLSKLLTEAKTANVCHFYKQQGEIHKT